MKSIHVDTLEIQAKDKSWKLKCDLQKLYPRLYLMKFDDKDRYDMCMTFCRYQEKYESSNPRFRNKDFELVDFMEWYSKDRDGSFSYPNDWAGFNIPNTLFHSQWYHNIRDKNKYDYFMLHAYYAIWHDIKYGSDSFFKTGSPTDFGKEGNDPKYYLIGATNDWAISHEFAHGLYYLNPKYKKQMNALTKKLPKKFLDKVNSWLEYIGYTPKVFADETQAYMATGFPESANIDPGKLAKPYEEIFKNVSY